MNDTLPLVAQTTSTGSRGHRRLKRHAAVLAARCAMASWLLLAAMPIIVVVCALA